MLDMVEMKRRERREKMATHSHTFDYVGNPSSPHGILFGKFRVCEKCGLTQTESWDGWKDVNSGDRTWVSLAIRILKYSGFSTRIDSVQSNHSIRNF